MNEVIKWIEIAKSDIKSSKILLENGCYSQSYFYFQQATEKANKASWMLDGSLKESQLKSIGHNQFKPLRKNLISQKDNIDYLKLLESKLDFILENPFLKQVDVEEYKENLEVSIKSIDKLKNQDLFDFEESELDEILEMLEELKTSKLELQERFSEKIKSLLIDYVAWLKKFNSEQTTSEADELSQLLDNDEKFQDYLKMIEQLLASMEVLIYTSYTFYFCSILTVQHSNSTRYPQELDGKSPLKVYNRNLEIIKKQHKFLNYLDDALDRLSKISVNYVPKVDENIIESAKPIKSNYIPDWTWDSFGIKSKSDFHRVFVIPKNTHSEVPEKITKELAIAEQLQSLSYFHYPLYGDVFSRLTRIFEMAVKAKATQLNIETKNKRLFDLINSISIDYSEHYRFRLNWARKMRNMNAHPEVGTIYGMILKLPLIRLTNIINDIFRTKDFFIDEEQVLKNNSKKYKSLKEGLWILDNLLIHSVSILAVRDNLSLWAFYPVRQNYPQNDLENLYSLEPICAILKHHRLKNGSLIAKDINNLTIELKTTDLEENLFKLEHYLNLVKSSKTETRQKMEMVTNQSLDYQIENFYHVVSSY